mmetsp:Transcript_38002/g.109660  ORF Transcript_38002/g.109660 Transcript_38002/m.109660 type:complete len:215 (-) Transcript_38002:734-1378(-)
MRRRLRRRRTPRKEQPSTATDVPLVPSLDCERPRLWDGSGAIHGSSQLTCHSGYGVGVAASVRSPKHRSLEARGHMHTVQSHRHAIHTIRACVTGICGCAGSGVAEVALPPSPIPLRQVLALVLCVPCLLLRICEASCGVEFCREGLEIVQQNLASTRANGLYANPCQQSCAISRLLSLVCRLGLSPRCLHGHVNVMPVHDWHRGVAHDGAVSA